MAISRARKEELVQQYMDLIDASQAIFIAEYGGMNVKSLEGLRQKAREVDGAIFVTKNTLLAHALREKNRPVPEELLVGQVAAGFATGEAPSLAKTLMEYAKGEANLKIKGGILDQNILNPAQIEALADLPPLDHLRAQILGLINAPAQNIAGVIAGGVRQIVNVLDAYAKKADGDAAAEAA